jgi:hypothetical protein
VAALRKRKVDGALYCRPADIENLLGVLIRIDEADALARARIRSRCARAGYRANVWCI